MLRQFKEMIRKEMLILLRDRQTILLLFLMPVALIFFLSLAMEGVWTDKLTGRKIRVAVKNESLSYKANLLEEKIKSHPMIEVVSQPAAISDERMLEDGKTQLIVTIPKGFEEGERPVALYFEPSIDAGYKMAARSLITTATVEVVMGLENLDAVIATLIVEKTRANRDLPTPLQHSVPAYAIFAMFFIAIPMSIGFLREKNDGTLQRLKTYPISPALLTLGKIFPYYLINIIQFVLMMLMGVFVMSRFVIHAFHLGGHPWHLIPVTLVVAAATTGFGVMVAALGRTQEQATTLAATGAVLMGVFGGIMFPHAVMPLVMKKAAMISPMYWAHQAYLDIFLRDASLAAIAPKLIILTGFAGICFYVAGRRVQWI